MLVVSRAEGMGRYTIFDEAKYVHPFRAARHHFKKTMRRKYKDLVLHVSKSNFVLCKITRSVKLYGFRNLVYSNYSDP